MPKGLKIFPEICAWHPQEAELKPIVFIRGRYQMSEADGDTRGLFVKA